MKKRHLFLANVVAGQADEEGNPTPMVNLNMVYGAPLLLWTLEGDMVIGQTVIMGVQRGELGEEAFGHYVENLWKQEYTYLGSEDVEDAPAEPVQNRKAKAPKRNARENDAAYLARIRAERAAAAPPLQVIEGGAEQPGIVDA